MLERSGDVGGEKSADAVLERKSLDLSVVGIGPADALRKPAEPSSTLEIVAIRLSNSLTRATNARFSISNVAARSLCPRKSSSNL